MKIEPGSPDILGTNKTLAAEERQVKSETLVAQIKPHPGHTVFEFDLTNGQVEQAKIEQTSATYNGGIRKKVIQRQHCLYCSALNKKNAIKKFIPIYDRLKKAGHIIIQES